MHILPAFVSTTNTRKRKSTLTGKQKIQLAAHQQWIEKMTKGVKADKKVLDKLWRKSYNESMVVDQSGYVSSGMSGTASSCTNRSLMSNLHKEPEHVRKEILDKASRVMSLFNKGGLQYATPAEDLTQVGTKSRRG
jgi:hypothetical protein